MPPAQTLTHAAACSRPTPTERTDQRGVTVISCPECHRFAVPNWRPPRSSVDSRPAAARRAPAAQPPVAPVATREHDVDEHEVEQPIVPASSRYRCRTHELPVRPTGTGCPRCASAEVARLERRRAQRAARSGVRAAKRARR